MTVFASLINHYVELFVDIYRERIPSDSPPSYRGQLVKYSYKITIGTQRVNSPVKLLRLPIRVLPVCEARLIDVSGLCNDTTEELTPANPFLEMRQKETPFDVALQTLQNITARRNPNFYMISNTWGKVARFCIFKPAYKLGEDIIGTFDFTVATVNCMQVSVSLQCEEETVMDEKNKQVRIITFSKHHEVCLGYKFTQMILPIPLHVTPTFATQLGKNVEICFLVINIPNYLKLIITICKCMQIFEFFKMF